MNAAIQAQTSAFTTRPHACSACGRRFVVIGAQGSPRPRCVCGAALEELAIANGIYELRAVPRAPKATHAPCVKAGSKHTPPADRKMPHEPDLGYGESHGYGPAHGGPSGPGDAPATEAPEAPSQAPSEKPAVKPHTPS